MNIDLYVKECMQLWNSSSTEFQFDGVKVSVEEKIMREEYMIAFSKNMKNDIDWKKLNRQAQKELIQQFNVGIGKFFKNAFKFSDNEIAIITQKGFSGVTKQFMHMARNFDSTVKIEDVFQASRNLWIVNSLQIMLGVKVELTKSIFAYSMLYPYTDNYLDDPKVSKEEKIAFSHRFRMRLMGETVIPFNNIEKIIFDLVSLIEGDWDRSNFPNVYESLVAIHDAQTKSILLMSDKNNLNAGDLLSICIEKGGTSVLADGYLISGRLTKEQESFCFGFGTYLQFVDDIQDLVEDSKGELETPFTNALKTNNIEEYVNRTISFCNSVMSDLSSFPVKDLRDMENLMKKSINFLLTEAIGLNDELFSANYVQLVEYYSPFRYEFVKKRRSSMNSNRISFMKKLEDFMFEELDVAIEA